MKFFSLLTRGDIHPSKEKKIIPAEEFSQLISASEIVGIAKEETQRLEEKTKEVCKTLKKEAHDRGFQEGLDIFNEEIFKIDGELKALRFHLQQMVLPIALKAAKRIVGKELEIFPETIVDIVIQAIKPISESRQITIFVNREDREHLNANKPKFKEILQQVEMLAIQEKADVKPGGCIIKTESGMINATIENQWRALERAFDKYKQAP